MGNLNERITFKGDDITVKDLIKVLVPKWDGKKINLTVKEIKDILPEFEDLATVETEEDLKEKFNTIKRGADVRNIVKCCLEHKKIEFQEKVYTNNFQRDHIVAVFFELFSITPKQKTEKEKPIVKAAVPEEANPITAPITGNITLEILQEALKRGTQEVISAIDVTEFTLKNLQPITLLDDFCVIFPEGIQVYRDCVGIAKRDEDVIVAIGKVEDDVQGIKHLIFNAEDINYDALKENRLFRLVFIPANQSGDLNSESYTCKLYIKECIIDFEELEEAKRALCIDFGTSNTTAGSFGIKSNNNTADETVSFLDVTQEKPVAKNMIPTMVYVYKCKAGEPVEYLFGYEAVKKLREKDYCMDATIFYEIKRWINDLESEEVIFDDFGNKAKVKHRDVIQAYLEHIICLSERHFKCRFKKLHFTAPVKLKDHFLKQLKKMFEPKGYAVMVSTSIDEGISIVYEQIAKRLSGSKPISGETHVMILDCGGGTTDLASCEYSVKEVASSKELRIKTHFENGDSNFGGNNITYRILQLLKIKIAEKLLNKSDISVQGLICDEKQILNAIDNPESYSREDAVKRIYSNFEDCYKEAERWIPTYFKNEKFLDQKRTIKRNYYYLWQMAESVKIAFYRANLDLVSVDFNNDEDRTLCVQNLDHYYLMIHPSGQPGEFKKLDSPMKDIEITINDIRRVIFADIYKVLKNILPDDEQRLSSYDIYQLTGQSCKITLFSELLKEFIPGNKLRKHMHGAIGENAEANDSSVLKMECIKGSIKYLRDKDFGYIKPKFESENPNLIYQIRVDTDRKGIILIGPDTEPAIRRCPESTQFAIFRVFDLMQVEKFKIYYHFENVYNEKMIIGMEDLRLYIKSCSYIENSEIDTIVEQIENVELDNNDPEICLFVVPSKNGYGMNIFQIMVRSRDGENIYYLQQNGKYESFENNTLKTFFDGER